VTRLMRLEPEFADSIDALLREVIGDAERQFELEGVDPAQIRFQRYGKLRYENQEHSVEVPLPDGQIDVAQVAATAAAFHDSYEREYTYRLEAPVEFVGVHVVAVAEVGKLAPVPLPSTGRAVEEARKGVRTVDFTTEGIHEATIYTGELLEPGMRFGGPAIIETKGSTIVIHPGNEVTIDDFGNIVIELAEANR
jgi:N-methylhydantoinase A